MLPVPLLAVNHQPRLQKYPLGLLNLKNPWSSWRKDSAEALAESGYYWNPQFLRPDSVHSLYGWAQELAQQGHFRTATIGKGAGRQQAESIRSDHICWLDPAETPEYQMVAALFKGVMQTAREDLYLSAKRFECHFAKYDPGSFYRRHRDRHRASPRRLFTCVLYLNTLRAEQGGQLKLYLPAGQQVVITPQAGGLIVFDSEILHEVSRSQARRWSLTGWIRDDIHPGIELS